MVRRASFALSTLVTIVVGASIAATGACSSLPDLHFVDGGSSGSSGTSGTSGSSGAQQNDGGAQHDDAGRDAGGERGSSSGNGNGDQASGP